MDESVIDANQKVIDELILEYGIDIDHHFKVATDGAVEAQVSFAALAHASIANADPSAFWGFENVTNAGAAMPRRTQKKWSCGFGAIRCKS